MYSYTTILWKALQLFGKDLGKFYSHANELLDSESDQNLNKAKKYWFSILNRLTDKLGKNINKYINFRHKISII